MATFLFTITSAWSHALWIETSPIGKKGEKHEIKVHYGEYAEGNTEALANWYSDTKEFELWVISPSGEKQKLATTPHDKYFETFFTPEQDGEYSLYISHAAKDLGGKTLYQFNTSASVKVGQTDSFIPAESIANDLKIIPHSDNSYIVLYKSQVASGISVELAGPTGWSKVFTTDELGMVTIETPWEGAYLLEATKSIKESGQHHDNTYEAIWRCATYRFDLIF
ncbi:nickel uptake transporter family protein [Belliella marina]|uniref:Nickel uptake transporter family protein n=1 Tax=Belliella marina TaxID=1644146 RepID=A0ABW4VLH7_9BACT